MLFVFAAWTSQVQVIIRGGSNGLVIFALLHSLASAYGATDVVDLRPSTQVGGYRQAKVVVEVEGKLTLNADGQAVKHLPLRGNAELQYVERAVSQAKQWSSARLVRHYTAAEAKIRLHQSDLVNNLRTERRLIVVDSDSKRCVVFAPLGPLTREELDLVEVPAGGVALESLLPPRAVKIGSQWNLADGTVARLLNLEVVSQQDIALTLDSVKDDLAIVSLAGKATGAVSGVGSDVELNGKLNFDLKKRSVTWLALALKENRAIGHAQPGFETLTTLRMVCAPIKPVAKLSDKSLAGLPLTADRGPTQIELVSETGGFQLTHDRRWSVMLERGDLTVLRLVDRGDLIAQCNISPRPPLGTGEQLTLEGFQDDVKRVLGKNFEELVEASEETTDQGLRLLRVLVAGKVGDLAIQWTYYHLADNHGRRASLVFTIESGPVERFAGIDRDLIAGLRFIADKEPTPVVTAREARSETQRGPVLH